MLTSYDFSKEVTLRGQDLPLLSEILTVAVFCVSSYYRRIRRIEDDLKRFSVLHHRIRDDGDVSTHQSTNRIRRCKYQRDGDNTSVVTWS